MADPLKYRFSGVYMDGTEFSQSLDDVSEVDPKRSSMYDVRVDDVKLFRLTDGRDHDVTVDLISGCFKVNGLVFLPFSDDELTGENRVPLKLHFWRRHQHDWQTTVESQDEGEETAHRVFFIVGWETHESPRVKRTILFR